MERPVHNTRNPLRWSPDRWIALSAVVMAVCALAFTLYEFRAARTHRQLSTLPVMMVAFYYAKDGAGFRIGNVGLGPARLEWFRVRVDGKEQPDWRSMFGAIGFPQTGNFEFLVPGKGWWQPPDMVWILKVPPGPGYDGLKLKAPRIELDGCYCSVFEKCWTFSRGGETRRVRSCQPAPALKFSAPPARPGGDVSTN